MTSRTYRNINASARAKELDRTAWAGPHLVVATWDVEGTGTTVTDPIQFGTVFEGHPFFSYGTELQADQTLGTGGFPFVSCGVAEWVQTEPANERGAVYTSGATVWINVQSGAPYRLRLRFGFEGIAMRNREYIS